MSRWVCEAILVGETYPAMPGIDRMSTIVDVGANRGAASVYFARCYPEATVHALEPGHDAFILLERNESAYPNIRVHNVGLDSSDRTARLYEGVHDASMASIYNRPGTTAETGEEVTLRDARAWLREQGIDSIDVLKADAEGCEPAILESVRDVLPEVSVIYAESDDAAARLRIDRLLAATHEAVGGKILRDQGLFVYVQPEVLRDNTSIADALRARVEDHVKRPRAGSSPT